MRLTLPAVIVAVMAAACNSLTSTARGISVLLEANPKVAQTGDTVTFTVSVAGSNVSGIVINYGDSKSDQYLAGGTASAYATFKHVYADSGNYMSRATVSDAVVGDRVVTQLIVVNRRSDSTQTVGLRHRTLGDGQK